MELDTSTFKNFLSKVKKARQAQNLPEIHHYDLEMYCQTLVNAASTAQLFASMACSDRLDLIEDDPDELKVTTQESWNNDIKLFTTKYLGLPLITSGDPRGAVFKLQVPQGFGDSFGSNAELCVPCNDAYFCA